MKNQFLTFALLALATLHSTFASSISCQQNIDGKEMEFDYSPSKTDFLFSDHYVELKEGTKTLFVENALLVLTREDYVKEDNHNFYSIMSYIRFSAHNNDDYLGPYPLKNGEVQVRYNQTRDSLIVRVKANNNQFTFTNCDMSLDLKAEAFQSEIAAADVYKEKLGEFSLKLLSKMKTENDFFELNSHTDRTKDNIRFKNPVDAFLKIHQRLVEVDQSDFLIHMVTYSTVTDDQLIEILAQAGYKAQDVSSSLRSYNKGRNNKYYNNTFLRDADKILKALE